MTSATRRHRHRRHRPTTRIGRLVTRRRLRRLCTRLERITVREQVAFWRARWMP